MGRKCPALLDWEGLHVENGERAQANEEASVADRDERQTAFAPNAEQIEEARADAPTASVGDWQGYDLDTLNTILDG